MLTKHRIVNSMPNCDAEDPIARRQRVRRNILAWTVVLLVQALVLWAACSCERKTTP